MEKYRAYLSNLLGIEQLEFINYDGQGYYFNGINKGKNFKVKVIGTRVFVDKNALNIKVIDPFDVINSLK